MYRLLRRSFPTASRVLWSQKTTSRNMGSTMAIKASDFNSQDDYLKYIPLVAATLLGSALLVKEKADCCGIVGYIGEDNAQPILMNGIQILQNRGYDSAGMGTISPEGELTVTKFASIGTTSDSIEILRKTSPEFHNNHHIGIAHTRWATHGGKVDKNAHPHLDSHNRLMLVHNGTIDNYVQLKTELLAKGFTFRSDTDSEVIANLISYFIDEGFSFEKAVEEAIIRLQGTWGLVVMHKDFPDRLVVARNGSPLLVGSNGSEVFVASEQAALAGKVTHFVTLKDGETAVVTREGIQDMIARRVQQKVHVEDVKTSPAPFSHWTLKEIYEQPQSLARALNYGGRITPVTDHAKLGGLDDNKNRLAPITDMIISACGTSLYAGMYGQLLMEWLGCFRSVKCVDASELSPESLPERDAHTVPGVVFISQSGETLDVIKAVNIARGEKAELMSVVNVVGSQLSRETGCGVYLNAGREVAVASTKAFTSQVTVLSLIASWFAQQKQAQKRIVGLAPKINADGSMSPGSSASTNDETTSFLSKNYNGSASSAQSTYMSSGTVSYGGMNGGSNGWDSTDIQEQRRRQLISAVHRLPVTAGMALHCEQQIKDMAARLKDATDMFILAKGFGYPVALEGALKIKEISYVHAEGFAGGALKHGPFALIDQEKRTPVVMIITQDQNAALMINAAEQVVARGAELICITDQPSLVERLCKQENIISIPQNGPLTALLAAIPLQLLAFHLAVEKGYNPDFPRGLAKTVTVL